MQLEREAEARGASVRNFGLVWVSGRKAGPELSLALRARELWAELGAQVPGLGFRAAGSLTLAADDAELSLLKEAAALPDADAAADSSCSTRRPSGRSIPRCAARWPAACSAAPTRSSSRGRSLPALRGYLAGAGYEWLPGREVTEIAPNAVRDHTGAWHQCDLVILCPGAAHTGVAGRYLARGGGVQAGPAADDADRAAGRAGDHGAGRRRLAALLPRLRPARPGGRCRRRRGPPRGPGPSCCWSSGPTAG